MSIDYEDERNKYLISKTAANFGISLSALTGMIKDSNPINIFLDDVKCMLLFAVQETDEIRFSNNIQEPNKSKSCIVFFKHCLSNNISRLTIETLKHSIITIHSPFGTDVLSLLRSTIHSLYTSCSSTHGSVCCPSSESNTLQKDTKALLYHLNKLVSKENHDSILPPSNDIDDVASIETPNQELLFWKKKHGDTNLINAANKIVTYLRESMFIFEQSFDDSLTNFDSNRIVESCVEKLRNIGTNVGIGGCLESTIMNIFNVKDINQIYVYSVKRMVNTLNIFSSAFINIIREIIEKAHTKCKDDDLLSMKSILFEALSSIKAYIAMISRVLTVDFKAKERNSWSTGYVQKDTKKFQYRIDKLHEAYATYFEVQSILPGDFENEFTSTMTLQDLFKNDILNISDHADETFTKFMKEFDLAISCKEEMIVECVRHKIKSVDGSVLLSIRYIGTVINLVRRPSMSAKLVDIFRIVTEKTEKVLISIGEEISKLLLMNNRIESIFICRRYLAKIKDLYIIIKSIDMKEEICLLCHQTIDKCKTTMTNVFGSWRVHVSDELSTFQNMVQGNDELIKIDDNGYLKMNLESSLFRIISEQKTLMELGFTIPKQIQEISLDLSFCLDYEIKLKKIVNLYNRTKKSISPEQNGLLDKSLDHLRGLLLNQNMHLPSSMRSIKDGRSMRNIEILHVAVEKLTEEKKSLQELQKEILNFSFALVCSDVIENKINWVSLWNKLNTRVNDGISRYSIVAQSHIWYLYWQSQLNKALNTSYQKGIFKICSKVKDMKCFLSIEGDTLQISPPMPTLRQQIYKNIESLIVLPLGFNNLTNPDTVSTALLSNPLALKDIYELTEKYIAELASSKLCYQSWEKVCCFNAKTYLSKYCEKYEEFSINLYTLKESKKELERIPSTYRIGHFLVSTTKMVHHLSDILDEIHRAVTTKLHNKITDQFKDINGFLNSSMEFLSSNPISPAEVVDATLIIKKTENQYNIMKELAQACLGMVDLLYSQGIVTNLIRTDDIAKKRLILDIKNPKSRWQTLGTKIQDFKTNLQRQLHNVNQVLETSTNILKGRLDEFSNGWTLLEQCKLKDCGQLSISEFSDKVSQLSNDFSCLNKSIEKNLGMYKVLNVETPDFSSLKELNNNISNTIEICGIHKEYTLDMETLSTIKWFELRTKLHMLDEFVKDWTVKLKDYKKIQEASFIIIHMEDEINKIKMLKLSLVYCTGEAFKEDHWAELIQGKLSLPKSINIENLRFRHFFESIDMMTNSKMMAYLESLKARSLAELAIREDLNELISWTKVAEVQTHQHECDNILTPIIVHWKGLFDELGEKSLILSSMKSSPFFRTFNEIGTIYEEKLIYIENCLQTLQSVQTKWLYLEPIFRQNILAGQNHIFEHIDKEIRKMMMKIENHPKLFDFTDSRIHPKLHTFLNKSYKELEKIQKEVAKFLEEKRFAMPRFFFLGDDGLLELLGKPTLITTIKPKLKILFQAIDSLGIIKNNSDNEIISVFSAESECFTLQKKISICNFAEQWISSLASEHRISLSVLLEKIATKVGDSINIDEFPAQILCLAEAIEFNRAVEEKLKSRESLVPILENINSRLQKLTSLNVSEKMLLRLKVKSLVLDIIKYRDIASQLIRKHVIGIDEWEWQSQLRYNLNEYICTANLCGTNVSYTFEYQGNQPKLVHTALTDKCYLNLTQAIRFGFGGNPFGPAGTGKTETVKSLGAALGRHVLVFNCDDGIDNKSISRMFIGIVMSGAWGCFDEFNRLRQDQLSSIAQQIQIIQNAMKWGCKSINLLGCKISTNLNAGIFVTLNPAGKGYGGRSRIPSNLKALFRPVSMSKPNNNMIIQTTLLSDGFSNVNILSQKIDLMFLLMPRYLSSQRQYDWGLRSLKTVLQTSCKLLEKGGKFTDNCLLNEEYLIIEALKSNIAAKLAYQDLKTFEHLLNDIFPENCSTIQTNPLSNYIKEENGYLDFGHVDEMSDGQKLKLEQLHECLNQRTGCLIVGPCGCGKTYLWQTLRSSLLLCGKEIKTTIINPKSMSRLDLIGRFDCDTREWDDGALTCAIRQAILANDTLTWIICDGDIDPEWIEALNSVLDDNMVLTLPNGERLLLHKGISLIFETHTLRYASPATISRMGIVCLSQGGRELEKNLISKWLKTVPEKHHSQLKSLTEKFIYRFLDLAKSRCLIVDGFNNLSLLKNCTTQINSCTDENDFILGLIRGIGGCMHIIEREKYIVSITKSVSDLKLSNINSFGNDTSVNDAVDKQVQFKQCDEVGTNIKLMLTKTYFRFLTMIKPWIENHEHFIVAGPSGFGKKSCVEYALSLSADAKMRMMICNVQTEPIDIVNIIRAECSQTNSSEGRLYRPERAEKLVIFVKHIEAVPLDQYGSSHFASFLHYLVSHHGFYDGIDFFRIERVQIVLSLNENICLIHQRLYSQMKIGVLDLPQKKEMESICQCILQRYSPLSQSIEILEFVNALIQSHETPISKFDSQKDTVNCLSFKSFDMISKNLRYYNLDQCNIYSCFVNELHRVIADEIVFNCNIKSQQSAYSIVTAMIQKYANLVPDSEDNIVYSSITGPATVASVTKKTYFSVHERKKFLHIVEKWLVVYKRDKGIPFPMNLNIQFLSFLEKIEHALLSHTHNLIIVGKTGVGRRTAIKFVCFMNQVHLIILSTTNPWNIHEFKKQVKKVLLHAVMKDEKVCLFVADYQLTEHPMISVIDNIITMGEVILHEYFNDEELESILNSMNGHKLCLDEKDKEKSILVKIKQNLHICLSLDNMSKNVKNIFMKNPSLQDTCCLKLFEWSAESVNTYSSEAVEKIFSSSKNALEGRREYLSEGMKFNYSIVVKTIEKVYEMSTLLKGCPQKFRMFLKKMQEFYERTNVELDTESNRLQQGLDKLYETNKTVESFKLNAREQKKRLQISQREADKAMEEIKCEIAKSESKRIEIKNLKISLASKSQETMGRKTSIEQQLSNIQPALEAAKDAIKGIRRDNLNEIRSLKNPPPGIVDVLSGVLTLLNIQDLSWISMKKFLGRREIKEEILNFDSHSVNPSVIKSVTKIVKAKSKSFDPVNISRISVAAAPLAAWVNANIEYITMIHKISPLQDGLIKAREEFERFQNDVIQYEKEVQNIDQTVHSLQETFTIKIKETEVTKSEMEAAQKLFETSFHMVQLLEGEHQRWEKSVTEIMEKRSLLWIDVLLAALYVVYLGSVDEIKRTQYVKLVIGSINLETSVDFDLLKSIGKKDDKMKWTNWGLKGGDLSIENCILIDNSKEMVPFIIDPDEMTTKWIVNYLEDQSEIDIELVDSKDDKLKSICEVCVKFGKCLIIKDCNGVHPFLYPLLRRGFNSKTCPDMIQFGDNLVQFNPNFRMILVSNTSASALSESERGLVVEINFSLTKTGIEDELLENILTIERPKLMEVKKHREREEEESRIELMSLEHSLLNHLRTSDGDLIANSSLIETLIKTKEKSKSISIFLQEIQQARIKIEEEQNLFEKFVGYGVKLWFLLSKLYLINHFYRFSFKTFLALFRLALTRCDSSKTNENLYVDLLCHNLLSLTVKRIQYSISREDFDCVALYLVHGMSPESWPEISWEVFIGSKISVEDNDISYPCWVSSDKKDQYNSLKYFCPQISFNIESKLSILMEWYSTGQRPLLHPPTCGITPIECLLFINIFYPSLLNESIYEYCCLELKKKTIYESQRSLNMIWEQYLKHQNTVILFVVEDGLDPGQDIEDLAESMIGSNRFESLSMGTNQEVLAINRLHVAAQEGRWLCIKNVHLAIDWILLLEKELEKTAKIAHPDFRIWITTEDTDGFPMVTIERSFLIIYESPPGVKDNIIQTYEKWKGENIVDQSRKNNVNIENALFILAWVHSLIVERRNYSKQGWKGNYDFNFSDIQTGKHILLDSLSESMQLKKWDTIHRLFLDFVYGGRMDDEDDKTVLIAYLQKYFNDEILSGEKEIFKGWRLPKELDVQTRKDAISRIVSINDPLYIGLPANINKTMKKAEAADTIRKLRLIEAPVNEANSYEGKTATKTIFPILEYWNKIAKSLHSIFLSYDFQTKAFVRNEKNNSCVDNCSNSLEDSDPLYIYLRNELVNGIKVFELVNKFFVEIAQHIKQNTLDEMRIESIQKCVISLAGGNTPGMWKSEFWEGPKYVTKWLLGLTTRLEAIWSQIQDVSNIFTQKIRLSYFFNPSAFFSSLQQRTAREMKCSIQDLKLACSWSAPGAQKNEGINSELSVSIEGISIQGALLDTVENKTSISLSKVVENSPDRALMPDLNVSYTLSSNECMNYSKDSTDALGNELVNIPLYQDSNREKLLIHVPTPCCFGLSGQWKDLNELILVSVAMYIEE